MTPSSISHAPNQRNQDSPTVVILPGASLMRIEHVAPGVMRVTCPQCGASHTFRARTRLGEHVEHVGFEHESAECPVLLSINAALAALRRAADANLDVLAALDQLCPSTHITGH